MRLKRIYNLCDFEQLASNQFPRNYAALSELDNYDFDTKTVFTEDGIKNVEMLRVATWNGHESPLYALLDHCGVSYFQGQGYNLDSVEHLREKNWKSSACCLFDPFCFTNGLFERLRSVPTDEQLPTGYLWTGIYNDIGLLIVLVHFLTGRVKHLPRAVVLSLLPLFKDEVSEADISEAREQGDADADAFTSTSIYVHNGGHGRLIFRMVNLELAACSTGDDGAELEQLGPDVQLKLASFSDQLSDLAISVKSTEATMADKHKRATQALHEKIRLLEINLATQKEHNRMTKANLTRQRVSHMSTLQKAVRERDVAAGRYEELKRKMTAFISTELESSD